MSRRFLVFLISACTMVAVIASAPCSARSVGTEEDCAKIGGTWKPDPGGWVHSCWVDWQGEKCRAEGGNWFPYQTRCRLGLTVADVKVQCEAQGGAWGRHGGNVEHCFFEEQRATCLANGGEWVRMGILQAGGCLLPSRDGGRPCTSSSQCQFKCLATSRPSSPGAEVTGECAKDNNRFGCRAFVEDGRFVQGPCVD
jgi:hypothetical protein